MKACSLSLSFNGNVLLQLYNIRIHHDSEGGMEKIRPEACRVMTNADREVRIFLRHPLTNIVFFLMLNIDFLFKNKLPEVPEYVKMQYHMMTSL